MVRIEKSMNKSCVQYNQGIISVLSYNYCNHLPFGPYNPLKIEMSV
jgi:hypothetical protein